MTVAAIAIVATAIADVIHEGLGHGACARPRVGSHWRFLLCTLNVVPKLVWWVTDNIDSNRPLKSGIAAEGCFGG